MKKLKLQSKIVDVAIDKTLQKNKKAYWKTIGHVGVDSGTLLIADPCYLINEGFSEKDYDNYIVKKSDQQSVCIPLDNGRLGKAVTFASGCGDGVYEIKAKFENLKDWGERITEVRIIMK